MQIPKKIDFIVVTDWIVWTRENANMVNKINEIIDYLEYQKSSQSSSENEDKPKELIKELDEAKWSWIINWYEICLIEWNRFWIKGFDRSVSIETLLNTIEDKSNTTDQDFWWIYDCAIAIKEYREEEWSRWTIAGIEDIITRHYKNR